MKNFRESGSDLPVLLPTAKSEIDDKVLGLDTGTDDYLTKPFAMKVLLARIRAMTRRQAEVTDSVLSFGNVRLGRSTYVFSTVPGEFRLAKSAPPVRT